MATSRTKKITAKEGTGNVFADLGLPNPEREQLKAHLTLQIYRLIRQRRLTQTEAGEILGKDLMFPPSCATAPAISLSSASWTFSWPSARTFKSP